MLSADSNMKGTIAASKRHRVSIAFFTPKGHCAQIYTFVKGIFRSGFAPIEKKIA